MNTTDTQLHKDGFTEIRESVWARENETAVLERLAGIDLFVSDFDECMHPAITQADVTMAVYRRVMDSMLAPRHLPLFLNMTFFAGPILGIKFYQKVTGDIQNSRMIGFFEKLARGIPVEYFEDAAEPLSTDFFTGVADTLRLLNTSGVPSGIISLGIDVIIGEMLRTMENREQVRLDFFDCTRVEIDARSTFRRYQQGYSYNKNEDKRTLLRARSEKYSTKQPLVIGHDRDDLMMFDESHNLGGLTLGFRPMPETLPLLDIAVNAENWSPIYKLLKDSSL